MLGRFDNFPKNIHNVVVFSCPDSKTKIQKTILQTLQQLNPQTFTANKIEPFLDQNYTVSFEIGLANGPDFIFLDETELKQSLKAVEENASKVLDFFVVVRYHRNSNKGKQIPLRFDYHVLRFAFHEKIIELLIRHERGTQRISTEDLVDFLTKQVNIELKKRQITPLIAD